MSTCGMFVYFRIRFCLISLILHIKLKMFYKKQYFKTMLSNNNKTFVHKYEIR